MNKYLYAIWYRQYHTLSIIDKIICAYIFIMLLPFSLLYALIIYIRKKIYIYNKSRGKFKEKFTDKVKVIVIGNIVIGGSGKTPIVIALAKALQQKGKKVGIISRGYGVRILKPIIISAEHNSQEVGDEPLLIYLKTNAPTCVHPNRCLAMQKLLNSYPDLDVIISDDGLQNLALKRDIECVVFSDVALLGNGLFIPAGPLRERMRTWDYTLCTQNLPEIVQKTRSKMICIQRKQTHMYRHDNSEDIQLITQLMHENCILIAGVAHPQSIKQHLIQYAHVNTVNIYAMQDHQPIDIHTLQNIYNTYEETQIYNWVMTEKDYVKCRDILDVWLKNQKHTYNIWILILDVELPAQWIKDIIA